MSFLTPLFLIGGAAIALPIVLHLIRRSSREHIPFSSLMFLNQSLPRVTRQSRLENILLLLLRCLILLLLALGFARPFVQKPILPTQEAAEPARIILLVDSSASMRRENLWNTARARAESTLTRLAPGDQVSLVTFDRTARQLISFDQWAAMNPSERVSLTMQKLGTVSPGWFGTDLAGALITATDLFEESAVNEREPGKRQIVLISDLQQGSKTAGLQGYEWPRGIECVPESISADQTSNAGIQVLIDSDSNLQVSTNEAPRLRIVNAADSETDQFRVRWEPAAGGRDLEVYVPPGSSRVLTAEALPGGGFGERLLLTGDQVDFDNAAYYIPQKAQTVPVIYIGSDDAMDPEQSLYYLKRAFQTTRRQAVTLLPHAVTDEIPDSEFESASFLIAAQTLPDSQAQRVKTFLDRGNTVLLALDSIQATQTLGTLLGSGPLSAEEADSERYALLGEIRFEHPLFAPFADPRFSDFTKTHFWKHRRIALDQIPGAEALARFDDGSPAVIQTSVGKGTLLVLTSGWTPTDSQLARSSKFVPLLYSALDQATGIRIMRRQYWVGDPVVPSDTNSLSNATIRKPDGSSATARPEGDFTETDLPGIYTVGDGPNQWQFAVNLDPSESKTDPLLSEDLERFGIPLARELPRKTSPRTVEQKAQQRSTELESEQKLWRWIILAALVFVLTETVFAGRLTRRTAIAS